jgi:hypothetical protein
MTLPHPGASAVSGYLPGRTYWSIRETGQSFAREKVPGFSAELHHAATLGHVLRSSRPAELSMECGKVAPSFSTPEIQAMYSAWCGVRVMEPYSIRGTDTCSHVLPT